MALASLSGKYRTPATQIGTAIAALGLVGWLIFNLWPHSMSSALDGYFTTDDGASVFVDSTENLPPFDHHGKAAYRVWMYSTDGGVTKFPGYLERYTTKGKQKLESNYRDYKAGKTHVPPASDPGDSEIKIPNSAKPWVSRADSRAASEVLKAKMPTNSASDFQIVGP